MDKGYRPSAANRSTISSVQPHSAVHPRAQPLAARGPVGPDVLQPIEGHVGCGQEPGGHIGISQIGGMDQDTQQETRRLNEEMACAAIKFFRAVIAAAPPFRWFSPFAPR